MGFVDAVKTCLSDYATFSGRASRSEYWFMVLFAVLFQIVVDLLCGFVGYAFGDVPGLISGLTIGIIVSGLFLFLPMLAVTVRRLHDTDHSGWWYFISIVPVVGGIWLLVLLLQAGGEENQYGLQVY